MTDFQIRLYAFDWLRDQVEFFGGVLPRKVLLEGFSISGNKYGLVGPKGIWKPKGMNLPISINHNLRFAPRFYFSYLASSLH